MKASYFLHEAFRILNSKNFYLFIAKLGRFAFEDSIHHEGVKQNHRHNDHYAVAYNH